MKDDVEVYEKIKDEMTFIWYYLSAYIELYDHPDPNRAKAIQTTAPAFFVIVQASLSENILLRIARLLDPQESYGKSNLSFTQLFPPNNTYRKPAYRRFQEVARNWKNGSYTPLKDYRHKVLAHNDLALKLDDLMRNLPLLDDVKISLIRDLFQELWEILKLTHNDLYGTSLVEPSFGSLEALPQNIFLSLKAALYFEKEHEFPPQNWDDFEFKDIGVETPLRIIK
ncbi:MAG: hypothetical protein NTY50_06095 [Methylobacter sp.]|nr:hypothetical protein [Methylobacter sp.]